MTAIDMNDVACAAHRMAQTIYKSTVFMYVSACTCLHTPAHAQQYVGFFTQWHLDVFV